MTEGEGISNSVANEPSHSMAVEWLVDVYNNMPEEIGRNAWKKEIFEWF